MPITPDGSLRAVPLHSALYHEGDEAYYSANYDHGMKADEASLEEIRQCEALLARGLPSVVIGITDDEARKHEEEVHADMSVVECLYARALRKGKSLEYMIPYYQQSRRTAEPVE